MGGSVYPDQEPGQPNGIGIEREPRSVEPTIITYSAGSNVTTNAPSALTEGVKTGVGRVWAEPRSVVVSDSAPTVEVTLIATQKGVRAHVRSRAAGTTITSGSVRFWVQNPISKAWALGGVEETLVGGAQECATTDQFVTVGG